MDGQALLEDLDGWVLHALEDGLAQDKAWLQLARVIITSTGQCLYSVAELSRMKVASSASPAASVVLQLLQRGVTLDCLLQMLQAAGLQQLHSLLAPRESARIVDQSAEGLLTAACGESISITVQVVGNPPPSVLWYRGTAPLLQHTSTTLTIPQCRQEDEGVYLCLMRQPSSHGSLDTESSSESWSVQQWGRPVQVQLRATSPVFQQQPRDCSIQQGQQVLLECYCPDAYPAPEYCWYKDGGQVAASCDGKLQICEADSSSSGQYWCVARNAAGVATSRRATVKVSSNNNNNNNNSIRSNNNSSCSNNNSNGQLTILRQPRVLGHDSPSPNSNNNSITSNNNGNNSVTNNISNGSSITNRSSSSVQRLSRGQSVQLWFSVRCEQNVNFTWLRNGQPLQGSSSSSHSSMSCREGGAASDVHSSSILYTATEADPSSLQLLCIATSSTNQVASSEVALEVRDSNPGLQVYTCRRKWALLVGNRRYESKSLHTTLPDCQSIAASLADLGYRCLVLADLSLSHFRNAINLFAGYLHQGDYVVFYYGGHGYHEYGDRMIPLDGCQEGGVVAGGCLSPVWVRNTLLSKLPGLLFLVLDMCRTTIIPDPGIGAAPSPPAVQLPDAARCSVVLHATAVRCAALEAPNSTSVITKHLLHRLRTHAARPLTALAAALLQDVCNESSRVREQQYPVMVADLSLPRTLADAATAPPGPAVERWNKMLSTGGSVTANVTLQHSNPHQISFVALAPSTTVAAAPDTIAAAVPCASAAGVPCASAAGVPCASAAGVPCATAAGVPSATAASVPCATAAGVPGATVAGVPGATAAGVPGATVGAPSTTTTAPVASAPTVAATVDNTTNSCTAATTVPVNSPVVTALASNGSNACNIPSVPDATTDAAVKSSLVAAAAIENAASDALEDSVVTVATAVGHALAPAEQHEDTVSSTASICARASLLTEGRHPVSNIAVVEVIVIIAGPAVPYKIELIARGCRVLRGEADGVYRIEDLHCLTGPMMATVSFYLNNRNSAFTGNESNISSGSISDISNNINNTGIVHNVNENSGDSRNIGVNGSSTSNVRHVRVSLGYPGLAKTNLQLNDLRGQQQQEYEASEYSSNITLDHLNIVA